MSLSDNNPYNFNEYLEWRNQVDYYRDDPFIQKALEHCSGEEWPVVHESALDITSKASFRWRDMADAIARPEKRPFMLHYDGHHNRIDRIVRPLETEAMEREVFGEGLFSTRTSSWIKLIKMFLIYQNGEACIACPITCTEGLVEILKKYADTPELKSILAQCQEGIEGKYAIGAQYISEIQGGSDIPSNALEAVKDEEGWHLYGTKFFCSATHNDYAVVTAKPIGSEKLALFVVPSWLSGNKEKEIRNGYTIDRIKWKLGTSELTTGEITYNGAIAYPVGPLDRGVANVVGIVLTYSRLTVGLSAAAFMTRAVREAKKYTEFRRAFGVKIADFPMVASQIRKSERLAQQTTAGALKLYGQFLSLEGGMEGGLVAAEPEDIRKKRFIIRELIMLQKITASWDCTDVIRTSMSLLGGHGVMEDFSCLPRLYRDAAVNELWEGPRNVLLTQIHRDLQRAASWYQPEELITNMLDGANPDMLASFSEELKEILAYPHLLSMDDKTMEMCERWDNFCHQLFHTYQLLALQEIDS